MEKIHVPQGAFTLSRYPVINKDPLRAWDAADEYLLQYFAGKNLRQTQQSILVINDSFGCLATALNKHKVTLWTDSYLSQQGIIKNLQRNALPVRPSIVKSTELPCQDNNQAYDIVLIKIPKSHALLEDELLRLRSLVNEKTIIIAAAMAKNIHTSTLKIFEQTLGQTKTSLAKKKARLVFVQFNPLLNVAANPYPKQFQLEGTDFILRNHSNVFSRDKLDVGTRFFLQHLPADRDYNNVIDLGCGNGLLGIMFALKHAAAHITFTDESFMAIASAKENAMTVLGDTSRVSFITTDALTGIKPQTADLVLNNPPFHQQHAVGDAIAWRMFSQAQDVLKIGGELWVIGNRHLNYHTKLKKLFGNCETVASNKKFVIYKATR